MFQKKLPVVGNFLGAGEGRRNAKLQASLCRETDESLFFEMPVKGVLSSELHVAFPRTLRYDP
jgi:hypothetical protein